MAPEIISAIQTIPPPTTAMSFSKTNTSEIQKASLLLRQAQKERQDAAQKTWDAQAEEQQAQKNLQAAQAEERRATENVNSAQAEHQKATRSMQPQTNGKIINVLI